ncbi:MAG TPA: ferric reductase-like transmembrane domain-containing protein [Mycobacteriales bacterium]|nr:ferric reductase-like transmembrane domain-containing protein [Mycobacteriales bacterium]
MSTVGSPLWYTSRAAGVISLVLLTFVVLLGVLHRSGRALPGLQRFVVAGLHRNLSLLALAFLAVHIGTAVLDSYVPIRLIDAVVPFVSAYHPFWVGLGALTLDLLIALVATSLLRHRIGRRYWRAVHWAAYAAWPIALTHGLGLGTDSRHGWLLVVMICSGLAVSAATAWRLSLADANSVPELAGRR